MPNFSQASFKNSRVATRQATTKAYTIQKVINAGEYKKVLDINLARVYSTLINPSTVSTFRYSYGDIGAAIDTDGMILEAGQGADLNALEEIWVKNYGAVAENLQIDYGQG